MEKSFFSQTRVAPEQRKDDKKSYGTVLRDESLHGIYLREKKDTCCGFLGGGHNSQIQLSIALLTVTKLHDVGRISRGSVGSYFVHEAGLS